MAVAFDQLTLGNSDATAVTTLTINAASAGTNRLAIIFVASGGSGNLPGLAVTVGGSPATRLTTISATLETWYYVAPPTASTAYVATLTNITRMVNYVVTFNGVSQTTPIRQSLNAEAGSVSSSSLTFSSSVSLDMLVDIVHHFINEDEVPGASQTERSAEQFFANNNFRQSVSTKPVTGASEPTSWTWATAAGADPDHVGVCLNGTTSPGDNQVQWFMFKRWQGFLGELRRGLVPPDELRRRYKNTVTI